jgi:hypothetical protein
MNKPKKLGGIYGIIQRNGNPGTGRKIGNVTRSLYHQKQYGIKPNKPCSLL